MKETVYNQSAGGVVINQDKVLVITSPFDGVTSLPKGTLDKGESPESAAIREVKEETGYDVEIIKKLDDYTYEFDWSDDKHHIKTVTYFLMRLANDLPPAQNLQPGEDFKVSWLAIPDALQQFTYDEAKDAVQRAASSL